MSLPQFSNYIQIDESEQEEQTPIITNQKLKGESSTKPLQKQGKKGGSEERSWIWNYYEKLVAKSPYIRTVKYQVEIYGKKGLQPYGKIMNSKDYSTSNYIAHLNTAHGITKEMHD
ncbi:hypothetical protein GLOIN_2v1480358 [Rhizophagus irregularis DAOM 181602=DAOM 197198]|uniref:Uncharacterized protein n=1 Tax=Rhizophagus irregularis (strain DAOM 181602 / DAOM 197198 / MUCL 43194) TaxID=747089 RepID=U9TP80_RHIID|nr:hypothetical protein GLOIN_2v1480358 [Rhizophagus irregularis DAOM 181602=DAOM 197198]CAB4484264.1 unnamed protein product [Rhizophagus irregularis]CAG8643626.1 19305_t:CDS:2 [Rhizophagus irregularis]